MVLRRALRPDTASRTRPSFIADVLEHHAGLEPVGGNLSPMVEVTLLERGGGSSHLLHLVNGSGHFGVSYVEPVTMHDLEVVIPYDGEPAEVTASWPVHPLEWHASDGSAHDPRCRQLDLFEAIDDPPVAVSTRRA